MLLFFPIIRRYLISYNFESSQLTDQFEGSLIRVFRRLGELLRQMAQAAKVIGNSELKEKFEKASEMLERPNSVIFCSSLYL
jgi:ATP-dependent RNA helicase DOB1